MKIGDKVTYREENVTTVPVYGEVVAPTETEVTEALYDGVGDDVVMVAWADGHRYFEAIDDLVKLEGVS